MTKLRVLRENFTLIGGAIINKDAEKYVKTDAMGKNGWMKKTINLGVKVSDLNKIFVGLEAGFWSDEAIEKTKDLTGKDERGKDKRKQNWIYNGEMVDGEWKADNIPFGQRFEKEMMDKIPYYNRIRVAIEPETIAEDDGNGNMVSKPKTDDNGNTICKEKEFIFAGDAIDYIQKHLKHDQRIYIYGHSEINQYVNKENQVKTNINRFIDQIRLAKHDEENTAEGTTNFYFEKEGFDKSDFKKTRKYLIEGYKTYQNEDKVVVPVKSSFILDFSNPNVDWENEEIQERVKYLTDVFETAKKDCVYLH